MMNEYPVIIQGGMGAGVSSWQLAQAVSKRGELGVVSGTALDQILARRLQDGDPHGDLRRALRAFPFPAMAERVEREWFIEGGRAKDVPYRGAPLLGRDNSRASMELCIVSNFVEVYLASQGHDNPVGINYLEKIQAAHLPTMYGAMLAGVSYIIMGAGIPLRIPGVLDGLAQHHAVEYPIHVIGAQEGDDMVARFDPSEYMEGDPGPLKRPMFLPIVSSYTLAATMLKKANGVVNGLVLEMSRAGGHNAPPRGKMQLTVTGEPIYGERDTIDLAKIRELGVPFWLAGGYGSAEGLREALAEGAQGIQVGTAFEFANESGLEAGLKAKLLERSVEGIAEVFTDPVASPTGFPFKVARLEGTGSEIDTSGARPRICDLGFLREPYRLEDGGIGYRCSAEPVSVYLSKGGKVEDTVGRKCLCNGLLANIGLAQIRNGNRVEPALVTAGDDLTRVWEFLRPGETSYTAADVIDELLTGTGAMAEAVPELEPVCAVK
jgi:nitronate monooxygenase